MFQSSSSQPKVNIRLTFFTIGVHPDCELVSIIVFVKNLLPQVLLFVFN